MVFRKPRFPLFLEAYRFRALSGKNNPLTAGRYQAGTFRSNGFSALNLCSIIFIPVGKKTRRIIEGKSRDKDYVEGTEDNLRKES
jgi:hypothetical protein